MTRRKTKREKYERNIATFLDIFFFKNQLTTGLIAHMSTNENSKKSNIEMNCFPQNIRAIIETIKASRVGDKSI